MPNDELLNFSAECLKPVTKRRFSVFAGHIFTGFSTFVWKTISTNWWFEKVVNCLGSD